jgi:hypothetical protein
MVGDSDFITWWLAFQTSSHDGLWLRLCHMMNGGSDLTKMGGDSEMLSEVGWCHLH